MSTNGTNSLQYGGTFTNSGTLEIQSGTLGFNSGSFSQTTGETKLSGGALNGSTFGFAGGKLSGNGTINAVVINGGVLSPGSSPGTITINGSYTQTSAGILKVELSGPAAGTEFDRLVVNGPASLAGGLNVTLLNGYMPTLNDPFSIMTYSSHAGTFATVNFPALQNGVALKPQYSTTELNLQTGAKKATGQVTSQ